MKTRLISVLAVIVICSVNPVIDSVLGQGIYLEEEVTSPPIFGMAGENTLTQTWIMNDKLRRDEESKQQSTIIRSDLGKIWLIDHNDTTYREVSQEMFQGLAMIGLMMFGVTFDSLTGEPVIPEPMFHETVHTRRIGEWTAREFTIIKRGEGQLSDSVKKMSLWISRDTGLDSEMYSRMMRKMFGDLGSEYDGFFRQLESMGGYPVLVETTMMGMEIKQKLLRSEKRNIPLSLFELPEGYEKQVLDFLDE